MRARLRPPTVADSRDQKPRCFPFRPLPPARRPAGAAGTVHQGAIAVKGRRPGAPAPAALTIARVSAIGADAQHDALSSCRRFCYSPRPNSMHAGRAGGGTPDDRRRHPCPRHFERNGRERARGARAQARRCRACGARGAKMEVSTLASDHRLDPVMNRLREVRLPLLHHSWNTFSMGKNAVADIFQSDPDDIAELAAGSPMSPSSPPTCGRGA